MNARRTVVVGLVATMMLGWVLFSDQAEVAANASEDIPFKHVVVDENGPPDMHAKGVGDLNGDGLEDLVVAGTKGAIVWYENPTLAKHQVCADGGGWSCDAEVGDIDRDGDQDIVISDWYQGNRMVWFENSGAGQSWTMHVIGEPRAHDIELGDLDRDGDLDIVTRTQSGDGNKMQVWEQKSPSSWERRTIACPAGEGLTLADLDADGDPDLVIGSRWYETPAEIAGESFAEHVYSADWDYPNVAANTGDINQDGRLDIVLTPSERQGARYRCSWYEAPIDPKHGQWKEHVIEESIETVAHCVDLGDMDGDGDLDMVTAKMHQGANPDEVLLYVNERRGLVWRKQVVAETGSHNMRLVDIGGNGRLDIFGANWSGTKGVDLWENLSGPHVRSLTAWTYIEVDGSATQGFGLGRSDLTGDGYGDIVTARHFYRNPGGEMTGDWEKTTLPSPISDALLAMDVDGDAYGDIIGMDRSGGVYWVEAQDTKGTTWEAILVGSVETSDHGLSSQGYLTADLVAGARPEIIIHAPDGMYYFEISETNPEAGNWPRATITTTSYQEGVAAGDMDGDGDIDVCSTIDGARIAWWENPGNGAGDWRVWEIGSVPARVADRFYMADLDGDNDLDIVASAASGSANGVYWFEQPSDPQSSDWERHDLVNDGSSNPMNSLDIADMDNDGDIDLISGMHRGDKELAIWENDGSGTFTEHIIDSGKESHLGARVYELDGDGDLDITSICWDSPRYVHLWRNDAIVVGTPPVIPPEIVSVSAYGTPNEVKVLFSEAVEQATAETVSNYAVSDGIRISAASRGEDGKSVTLTTSTLAEGTTYTLTVNNVEDSTEHVIAADSQKTFVHRPIDLAEGLVAYWPFEEGAGTTAADVCGDGHDGRVNGAEWTAGRDGGALEFDGSNDYVDTGKWDVAGSEIAISLWLNADSFRISDARLISKSTGTAESAHYFMLSTIENGGSKLRFRLKTNGTTSTLLATNGTLSTGQWIHAAAVYDGTNMKIYKDGTAVGSLAKAGTISESSTVPVWVGRNPDGYGTFDGKIDEVRIYSRALTAEEIAVLATPKRNTIRGSAD